MKLSAKPQGKIHMFLIFQPDTLYDVIEWTDRPKPQICLAWMKAWRSLVCEFKLDLDSSRQVIILRKTTTFLMLKNIFRQVNCQFEIV